MSHILDGSCPRFATASMSKACPVPVGNSICGETNSLEIMKEFNRLYEERMAQVDTEAGGDCLQEKIKLQQEWIRNLTQQNEMLVRAVQELEYEATERVQQLEEKLHKSAQCLCEVMKRYREHDFAADLLDEPLQKISHLEDDIKNVLEFIRRIREHEDWNLDGLCFYNISEQELLGPKSKYVDTSPVADDCEGEKIINDKERTVQELTQKLNYYSNFGDVEAMARELQSRRKECESLQQEMTDMRQALTEEVAEKHDQIVLLKKDIQIFEERCRQADKQTAFKEDIIRELRKEIKQLKQQFTQEEVSKLNATVGELRDNLERTRVAQEEDEKSHEKEITVLNETISKLEQELQRVEEKYRKEVKNHHKEITLLNKTVSNLEQNLQSVEGKYGKEPKTCKICKGKSKVGFLENSEVQADLESKESELMKMLNDVESKMSAEIEKRNNEIQLLKNKVNELETSLKISEERAANLQDAVTLYSNSVNVLETSGEEAKFQISQQKITIANLQQALVEAKQEIDEMRKKTQDNDVKNQEIIVLLEDVLQDTKEEKDFIIKQAKLINREYELLQDLNFSLEVEHCDSLQDINMLESHLNKYKYTLKINEEQLKKLSKQKRCYEEIITYFKHEMSLMADQLNNLQELLTLSNEAAQQETSKIMQAFMEVQSINEKLSNQLCACEQKVQLENQMNQLHEAKICELQQLISEKEIDLSKHDQAVLNIRKTLNESLKQNESLQQTIVELNDTISSLQEAIKQYEYENCASKKSCQEFQEQIGGYCAKLDELKKHLDDKTAECLKLEMAYNNEKRALKAAQKQLQETENLQHQRQQELVKCLEELKQKLALCDENNMKLCKECESLQSQLATLSRKEAVKDFEIKRYRKIVGDLKSTMMELNTELNKNLAQKEFKTSSKNVCTCMKNNDKDDSKLQDICLGCPCEVEFYQKMVDILKKSVTELKRKLSDTQQKNKVLEQQIKEKDTQLSEVEDAKEKLNQKMLESRAHDQKITELEHEIERLTQELQVRSLQLSDVKKSANEINGSKCVQLACAQEEIASLKNEMTNILNRQYALKRENEELQSQTAQLHCTINCLNEKNKLFKDQLDQYILKVKNLSTEKETLLRKNKELLAELKSLQSMTYTTDKQQRLTSESLKQLEADIEDLKNNKEEICLESKNVIKNVRAWVDEQKKINSFVARREREFINTIKQLSSAKRECAAISSLNRRPTPIRTGKNNRSAMYSNLCTSPCSLGSQGTASFYDGASPPPSPDFGPNNEWYSTNFRTESDNSEEEYCVNTLENLTQQMRISNKIWMDERRSRRDCKVTKDVKDKN